MMFISEKRAPAWIQFSVAIVALALFGWTSYQALPYLPDYFTEGFHRLIAANLIGVAIGAALAFEFDRAIKNKQEQRQEERNKRRERKQYRRAILAAEQAVGHNIRLVQAHSKEINEANNRPDPVMLPMPDPEMIDDLLPTVLDSTGDTVLVRKLAEFRHDLHELKRKISSYRRLYYANNAGASALPDSTTGLGKNGQLTELANTIRDDCDDLVEELIPMMEELIPRRNDVPHKEVERNT